MPRYVGLLRGINVGGKNPVPMADLRALIESLGFSDVRTLIQSGNVTFWAPSPVRPATIEAALADRFGFYIPVVLRTVPALARVLGANPFPATEPTRLHVGFMATAPPARVVDGLDASVHLPEEFAIRGCDVYLHLPGGMGRAKLPAYLDRQLGIPTTIRNWNTVTKLAEVAGDP